MAEEPVLTPPPVDYDEEGEYYTPPPNQEEEKGSPEQIDDRNWDETTPPYATPYTHYVTYNEEPSLTTNPLLNIADFPSTPAIDDYGNTLYDPAVANHTYFSTFEVNRDSRINYLVHTLAFPSSMAPLPADLDSFYTLKPDPNAFVTCTTTTTSTTSTTASPPPVSSIEPLAKLIHRTPETTSFKSNVAMKISGNELSKVKNWFSKVTDATPVLKWISSWAVFTKGLYFNM